MLPTTSGNVAERFAKAENIEITPATKLELKAFYGGNKYYLFIKTVYSDIRMVGAPPSSIGKFGADTDNWMWPRHTGDFSLFRIYADKNGKPAEYSKDNVPLQVKKHLKISLAGVQEGDFTFVMGFPGRNWRYMIADEVEERMQTTNFMRQHVRGARQKVLMEQMLKDPAVRIHYASKYASSANYWKNAIGMNEGLIRLNVLDTKRAQQEELLARGREKGDDSYQKAFDEKVNEYNSFLAGKTQQFTTEAIEEAMQKVMDNYAGGISTHYQFNEKQLELADEKIRQLIRLVDGLHADDMHDLMFVYELKERLTVCLSVIAHLGARKETRWHSFAENLDHPDKSDEWMKYVNSKYIDGKLQIIYRDLVGREAHYEHNDR